MKLQFKLALYNALTKAAIIGVLATVMLLFIKNISVQHIEQRLREKRTKLISHLSEPEINDFLKQQGVYTDYNLLREEYLTLKKTVQMQFKKERFSDGEREIDGQTMAYKILTQDIVHRGKIYRLELGEEMATIGRIESVIRRFAFITLFAAAILTLLTDLVFTRFLLTPFYRIIDEKINKVNDPVHFDYTPIQTSTSDFKLLDSSINMLMHKFRAFLLTQKEFTGNVSHELLTPISLLSTRMENLLHEESLSVEGENKILENLRTLSRLKSIINGLLLITKIENDQYLKSDTIRVSKIIADVCEELEHRLLMLNLTWQVCSTADHTFSGNEALFHILLVNIVSNAIKYNVRNGSIIIQTSVTDGQFEVCVADSGIGMTGDAVSKIFNRFEKIDRNIENSSGLGLAIARQVAIFHNLELTVHSDPGMGTTVRIIFPKT